MSDYIVTARKWRPMKFDDVAAQDHVTVTLRNAIHANRIAHAYLFSGPRGVGKTTTARLLAKAVNCLNPVDFEPDNSCDMCQEITDGRSFDVLEIDGASNRGVDEIRNLRESVRYAPTKARYKVFIVDEVHMLTKEAFNALLKTLEEPPPHVIFIFATTEIHKIPATILSRCQRFDFRRISVEEIIINLTNIAATEGISIDDDAMMMIAKKGDGSLRDAQSIFDQVVALCGKSITKEAILQALNIVDRDMYFRVTDLIKARDTQGGLELVRDVMDRGYDIKEFLSGLTEHLRNILTVTTTGSSSFIEESEMYKKKYMEAAERFSTTELLRLIKLINGTEAAIRWTSQPRFRLETDLLQLISLPTGREVGEVLRQLDDLKKKLDNGTLREVPQSNRTNSAVADKTATKNIEKPVSYSPSSKSLLSTEAQQSSTVVKESPSTSTSTGIVSEGEVASRWSEFVSEVGRTKPSIGSVLKTVSLLGTSNGVIKVGCVDEFGLSVITRNKLVLSEFIQNIFRANGRIEPLLGDHHTGDNIESPKKDVPPVSPPAEHPTIAALKRELGAEPV